VERRFIAEAHADFVEKLAAGKIDSEAKKQELLDAYAEELTTRYPEWVNLQASVVAGVTQRLAIRKSSDPVMRKSFPLCAIGCQKRAYQVD
jgi:hypothetical protein